MELKSNMKFYQKNDGSCDIIFSEQELKIINEHKKLKLTAETLNHFGNVLVSMVARFKLLFNDDLANTETQETQKIEGVSPEEKNDTNTE